MEYDEHEIHHGNEFSVHFKPNAFVVRIADLLLDICCPTGLHTRICIYTVSQKMSLILIVNNFFELEPILTIFGTLYAETTVF